MFRWHRLLTLAVIAFTSAVPSFAENARQLTYPPAGNSDVETVFSPRGDKVAFGRVQHGVGWLPTVFVADIATGAVDSLVTGLPAGWAANGGLAWSPDGKSIAFYKETQGVGSAIWIADVPGPVVPRIIASCVSSDGSTNLALDSNGDLYWFDSQTPECNVSGLDIHVRGNMFGGPPPSPVVSLEFTYGGGGGQPDQMVAILQNGDVWHLCGSFTTQGSYAGNNSYRAGSRPWALKRRPPPVASPQRGRIRLILP